MSADADRRKPILIVPDNIPGDIFHQLFDDVCEHECFPCSICSDASG